MKLIEPGLLEKKVKLAHDPAVSYLGLMGYMARIPRVDAERIRHEKWMRIDGREEWHWCQCSGCGTDVLVPVQKDYDGKEVIMYRFCPHCMGLMDREELERRFENMDPALAGYHLEGNLLMENET